MNKSTTNKPLRKFVMRYFTLNERGLSYHKRGTKVIVVPFSRKMREGTYLIKSLDECDNYFRAVIVPPSLMQPVDFQTAFECIQSLTVAEKQPAKMMMCEYAGQIYHACMFEDYIALTIIAKVNGELAAIQSDDGFSIVGVKELGTTIPADIEYITSSVLTDTVEDKQWQVYDIALKCLSPHKTLIREHGAWLMVLEAIEDFEGADDCRLSVYKKTKQSYIELKWWSLVHYRCVEEFIKRFEFQSTDAVMHDCCVLRVWDTVRDSWRVIASTDSKYTSLSERFPPGICCLIHTLQVIPVLWTSSDGMTQTLLTVNPEYDWSTCVNSISTFTNVVGTIKAHNQMVLGTQLTYKSDGLNSLPY